MNTRHNAWKVALSTAALALFVIGCSSSRVQEASRPAGLNEARGEPGAAAKAIGGDAVLDLPGRIIVGILTAVGEPRRDAQGRTIILMPELTNRSSAPNAGVIELGTTLREQLAEAGAASGLAFVDEATLSGAKRAHYVLDGEAYTVQRNGQRYWEVFFTLFDVNASTGAKQDRRWENARGYLVAR